MRRKNLNLFVVAFCSGILFLSGCSMQKFNDMSYEKAISILQDKSEELLDIFFGVDAQQTVMDMSTSVDIDGTTMNIDIQSDAKVDYISKLEDGSLIFNVDVIDSKSDMDFQTSGQLNTFLIGDNMYLKLSKFSLKGPSAKDLLVVNMLINSMKGQWFKLGMSGFSFSKSFELYGLYNEKLGTIMDEVDNSMINRGSGVYNGIFGEYEGLNSWKYTIDEKKLDGVLHIYADMMNDFYSGLFIQYAQSFGASGEKLENFDFYDIFSGVTYENLQGYLIIQGKNEVIETVEGAKIYINGTGYLINYIYGKNGLFFEMKDDKGENLMIVEITKKGKIYDVQVNVGPFFEVKGDVNVDKFSKKEGINAMYDFNVIINMDSEVFENGETIGESESVENFVFELPLKGSYRVMSIDKFSLSEPTEAIDFMEILGDYIGDDPENDIDTLGHINEDTSTND